MDAELDDVPALRRRLQADALRAERLVAVRLEWKAAIAAREAAVDEDARAQRTLVAANAAVAACDAEIVRRREELVLLDGASEAQAAEIATADAVQALGRRRELATAEDQLHRLHEHAADARLAYDLAVADHMTATAPRLAEQLRTGEPCSVCGSRDHPAPALAAPRPPSQVSIQDVDARRAVAEAASTERDRQLGMVESLRTSLGFHAARSIDDLMEAAEQRRPNLLSDRRRGSAGVVGRGAGRARRARASVTIDEQRAAHTAATRAAELWLRSLRWHESRSFWRLLCHARRSDPVAA